MGALRTLAALVLAATLAAGAGAAEQGVKTSGKVMAWAASTDDGTDRTVAPNVEMDLCFAGQLGGNATFNVKLDVEDTNVDGDLIEEAYVTWAAGKNARIALGRKEVKAGQDVKLYEYDPLVHEDEQDNTFALEFGFDACDWAKIYVSDFINRAATAVPPEPGDDFLFQSYAVKAELALPGGLALNLSHLNLHDEAMGGTGDTADQGQSCLGFDWKIGKTGARVFVEYLFVASRAYTKGYDSRTVQLGAMYAFGTAGKASLGLSWETRTADAVGARPELDQMRLMVSLAYDLDKTNALWLEVIHDDNYAADKETNIVQIGTMFKF